jgi:hypothetical protein
VVAEISASPLHDRFSEAVAVTWITRARAPSNRQLDDARARDSTPSS